MNAITLIALAEIILFITLFYYPIYSFTCFTRLISSIAQARTYYSGKQTFINSDFFFPVLLSK